MPSETRALSANPADQTGMIPRFFHWLVSGSRTRWIVGSALLCSILPWFFSCPLFSAHPESKAYWQSYWTEIVQRKIADPLHDYGRDFPAETNESKRTFRLLVPAFAHFTHTGMAGVHGLRFTLQAVLLVALLMAAERACGDRLAALGISLAITGTHVGTAVWRDACYWFDNCAHAFLALALLARGPWLAAGAILLAALVDERAFVTLPLVLIFHLCIRSSRGVLAGLFLATPVYLLLRIGFTLANDWVTPTAGIGTGRIILDNLPNMPAALWFALEGGWLWVGLALWLSRTANPRLAFALGLCTVTALLAAGAVQDFTRSAAYGFVATLAAVALLFHRGRYNDPASLRRLAAFSAAVSLFVPNAMILGSTVAFESSLPVRALLAWLRTLV